MIWLAKHMTTECQVRVLAKRPWRSMCLRYARKLPNILQSVRVCIGWNCFIRHVITSWKLINQGIRSAIWNRFNKQHIFHYKYSKYRRKFAILRILNHHITGNICMQHPWPFSTKPESFPKLAKSQYYIMKWLNAPVANTSIIRYENRVITLNHHAIFKGIL